MQFSLVDATRLDLDSYQKSLMRLTMALSKRGRPLQPVATSNPGSGKINTIAIAKRKCVFIISTPSSATNNSATEGATREESDYVLTFASNGMLSTLPNFTTVTAAEGSVLSPSFKSSTSSTSSSSSSTVAIDTHGQNQPRRRQEPTWQETSHHRSPPSSPLSSTTSSRSLFNSHLWPPRYLLRLPLDPRKSPIESRLSAKRLGAADVRLLDGILRRLCDATPGAFQLVYSDGLSGMEHGNAIVYDGQQRDTMFTAVDGVVENLSVQQQQYLQQQYQKQDTEIPRPEKMKDENECENEDKTLVLGGDDSGNEFEAMLADLDSQVDRLHSSNFTEDVHDYLWMTPMGTGL
ncbi:hypothetical protein BGW41_002169 [Actinomortierella wolfii]|nr:hypothetical protein BGW41_002169 [Actinomortierella wolfii]